MWHGKLHSRLFVGICLVATIVLSCYSLSYWVEAVSDGFTRLASIKVATSSFLAVIAWGGLVMQVRGRHNAGSR